MRTSHLVKNMAVLLIGLALTAALLAGCACEHDWRPASCTEPSTCALCAEVQGEPAGHTWEAASCTEPQTCAVCGQTEGEALGHSWQEADCVSPQTCTVCGATQGEALGHQYASVIEVKATCEKAGILRWDCSACGHTYQEEYAATKYSAQELYALASPSLCEIKAYAKDGTLLGVGSGFVYTSDGQIVTNDHVIAGAYSATVTLQGAEYQVERVLAYSAQADLAVLKISVEQAVPLTICTASVPTGSKIYAIGASQGLADGMAVYADGALGGLNYVPHNISISEEDSGGPLLNEYGEVIGINIAYASDAQGHSLSVSGQELEKLVCGDGISLSDLYEKEYELVEKLTALVVETGEYYGDGGYSLTLTSLYMEEYMISFSLSYLAYEDLLYWDACLAGEQGVVEGFWLDIPRVTGQYAWQYYDKTIDCFLEGTLRAAEFTDSTAQLSAESREGASDEQLPALEQRCAAWMQDTYAVIELLLESMGYDMEHLGFTNHS